MPLCDVWHNSNLKSQYLTPSFDHFASVVDQLDLAEEVQRLT